MSYGYLTKSHINSTEFRQTKKDRQEFTRRYLLGEIKFNWTQFTPACTCIYKPYPHCGHSELSRRMSDWKPRW